MKDKALEEVREQIVIGHRLGVCDREGNTDFVTDSHGKRIPIAKPVMTNSSAKTYVYRNGKMILKG